MNLKKGCLICEGNIIYKKAFEAECILCHKRVITESECENHHYICDDCHKAGISIFTDILRESRECSPFTLFEKLMRLDGVHMHGPEHHIMIPCILLAAYKNSGGDIDIEEAFSTALKRSKSVPGGSCGFWGICGAAVGAGIYASIVTGATPLDENEWYKSQELVSDIGKVISSCKGVRCCKRVSFMAFEKAIEWTGKYTGIELKKEDIKCNYYIYNDECMGNRCPYK